MLLSDLQNLAQNSPLALAQMLSPFVEQTLQKQPKKVGRLFINVYICNKLNKTI